MGKVEAFTLEGLELWFNSSDHLPPHVHIKRRGKWEIRVFFLDCTDSKVGIRAEMGQEGSAGSDSGHHPQSRCGTSDGITQRMGAKSMQVNLNATNTTAPELTVLEHDSHTASVVRDCRRFRILRRPDRRTAGQARNVFVLVSATELPDVSQFVSVVNRRHQLRALLVRDDVEPNSITQMFERARLRMMRNTIVHSDPSIPRRVLTAWAHNAQTQLIAKASVSKHHLFVLSCALQPYELAFDSMAALKCIPEAERARFTVDEDGSYIHWPGPDVHIDLDAIRVAVDPRARAKAVAAKARHDARYGAAIAKLRLTKGLKQSDIKGLSERQVRRIEKGQGTTSGALRRLAAAHDVDLEEYLRQVAANLSLSNSRENN